MRLPSTLKTHTISVTPQHSSLTTSVQQENNDLIDFNLPLSQSLSESSILDQHIEKDNITSLTPRRVTQNKTTNITVTTQGDLNQSHKGAASPNISPSQSTGSPPRYSITRHRRTERKMVDWYLTVRKKWVIVGDSNLSRIPYHFISNLQIDSYPGANFRHAQALLMKATSSVVVEKVVLSFGLNSRNQKAKETTIKQLQGALRAAKHTFPYAEIWIPEVNFSTSLPLEEKRNLHTLNTHIVKNMPYIPALDASQFQTEGDNIHWTRDTSKCMLKHWISALNWASR